MVTKNYDVSGTQSTGTLSNKPVKEPTSSWSVDTLLNTIEGSVEQVPLTNEVPISPMELAESLYSMSASLEPESIGSVNAGMYGVNTGIATSVGMVGDAVNSVSDAATGVFGSEAKLGDHNPFDTESIKKAFSDWGVTPDVKYNDLNDSDKMVFKGGEVFGGTIPFAAAPFALARNSSLVTPLVNQVRNAPLKALSAEASMASGASTGATIAQGVDPDNPVTSMASQLLFSVVNPLTTALSLGGFVTRGIRDVAAVFTKSGKEAKAIQWIQDVIAITGEDPEKIVRALTSLDNVKGVPLTSGQKSGSPALSLLETAISKKNPQFASAKEKAALDANKQIDGLIDVLVSKGGDPRVGKQALLLAAKLRQGRFDDSITNKLRQMEEDVFSILHTISPMGGSTLAKEAAGAKAEEAMRLALKQLRGVETSLYNKIPRDIPAPIVGNTREAIANLNSKLLPDEPLILPRTEGTLSPTTHVSDVLGVDGKPMTTIVPPKATTGDLLRIINRSHSIARAKGAAGEHDTARMYNEVAEAAKQDLMDMGLKEGEDAFTFSAILADKFTKTFAGKAFKKDKTSAAVVSPEEYLDKVFGGSKIGMSKKQKQIEEGAIFADDILAEYNVKTDVVYGEVVRDSSEAFLREMTRDVVDSTGKVSVEKLNRFMRENDSLLERFPDLQKELKTAEGAQKLLTEFQKTSKTITKQVKEKAAFARVAGVEDPTAHVETILTSKNPIESFKALSVLAKHSGNAAREGLGTSTIDLIKLKSYNKAGELDFRELSRRMNEPNVYGSKSVKDMLVENKIMTKVEVERFNKLTDELHRIQIGMDIPSNINWSADDAPNALFDFFVKIRGAQLGTAFGGGLGSTGLIAASAGSKFLRTMLEKVPSSRSFDILIEASKNPKLMADLIMKVKTPKQVLARDERIYAALYNAGLINEDDREEFVERLPDRSNFEVGSQYPIQ